jgi:hypothetical protein
VAKLRFIEQSGIAPLFAVAVDDGVSGNGEKQGRA